MFGNLVAFIPKIIAPISINLFSRCVRNFVTCIVVFSIRSLDSSQALPKPTMAGTFSVPERSPPSWPPPNICGLSTSSLSIISAAAPFGPYIL